MNAWLVGATVLLAALLPVLLMIFRSSPIDGVVGLELTGAVVVMVLLLITEGVADTAFADLALVLATLSFGSGLVYARFFERWI